MKFFCVKNNLYPLIAVFSSVAILIFGLVNAKSIECTYFLIGVFLWMFIFGFYKQAIKAFIMFVLIGGIFACIAYFSSGKNFNSALAMINRFGTIFLALVPGMCVSTIAMTRNLSQLHVPRSVTLGMLITMSFLPVLSAEIKRVREAMKTRGVGSIFNVKIFYRAFLIPLVCRLVDISDVLALSIETRGFMLGKANYTIYKREQINVLDIMYILGLMISIILLVVL